MMKRVYRKKDIQHCKKKDEMNRTHLCKMLYFQGDKGDKGSTGATGLKGHTGHKGDQVRQISFYQRYVSPHP